MEFELGGDEGGCEFGISGGTSSCAPNLRGNIMKFLAVLVGNNWTAGSSSICSNLGEEVSLCYGKGSLLASEQSNEGSLFLDRTILVH